MKRYAIWLALIASYAAIILPFVDYMKNRPFVEKMGYTPEPPAFKLLAGDQYAFVAASLVMKVINYYGGLEEGPQNKIFLPPEYDAMNNTLSTALQLDPYNMDAYYFAQATMTWDARQVRSANELLEYGMRYRTWDFYLPFFAGFNYAYFLKDYDNAARCYKRVAELTGTDISNLAARYLYEAGKTQMAIDYLALMVQSARNNALKKTLQTRLRSFLEVRTIEKASSEFTARHHRRPSSIQELIKGRFLLTVPIDPYGGTYYIDDKGMVRTTSGFAFTPDNKK